MKTLSQVTVLLLTGLMRHAHTGIIMTIDAIGIEVGQVIGLT